jgi:hypothetical protein
LKFSTINLKKKKVSKYPLELYSSYLFCVTQKDGFREARSYLKDRYLEFNFLFSFVQGEMKKKKTQVGFMRDIKEWY